MFNKHIEEHTFKRTYYSNHVFCVNSILYYINIFFITPKQQKKNTAILETILRGI